MGPELVEGGIIHAGQEFSIGRLSVGAGNLYFPALFCPWIQLAAEGFKHTWQVRTDYPSPRYTTQWAELPIAYAK